MATHYQFLASFGDTTATAKGIEAAHKALAIDPQLAQAHFALGLGMYQAGRLRESLAALQKAAKLDPSFSAAHADFGNVLGTAGRFDEALQSAKRMLPLIPNQATAYYHVGQHLVWLDADSRAERFLSAAALRFPAALRLQILLSYLDLRRGRAEAALERIRRTVDTAPTNVEALLTRLEVAAITGSPDARRFAEPLLAESADAPTEMIWHSVKLLYAYQLHKEGQKARASELMDQVLAFQRGSDQGRCRLAVSANPDRHGPCDTWRRADRSGLARARLPGRVEGSAHRSHAPDVGVTPGRAAIRAAGGADGSGRRRDAGPGRLFGTAVSRAGTGQLRAPG